jgi:hypothetical protein
VCICVLLDLIPLWPTITRLIVTTQYIVSGSYIFTAN